MGLLKRLKKASLPYSTAWFSPKFNLGIGMILPLTVSKSLLMFIPISFKEQKSGFTSSYFMSFNISLCFSSADFIVFSEIFFLLNSSKFSGIPVMRQNSGIR